MPRSRYWVYALHNARWKVTRVPDVEDAWELTVSDEHGHAESTVRTTREGLRRLTFYLARECGMLEG